MNWTFFGIFLSLDLLIGISGFEIPLPGGRSIKVEEGGIVRIQLSDETKLPKFPAIGTLPSSSTLNSIIVRDTGTVKGFGAFATKEISSKTFLGFYEGEKIVDRENLEQIMLSKQRSDDYILSIDGGQTFIDGHQRALDRTKFSPVHLNHADKTMKECNCIRVLSEGSVAFFTSRNISIDEELCFDYGKNFWRGRDDEKI